MTLLSRGYTVHPIAHVHRSKLRATQIEDMVKLRPCACGSWCVCVCVCVCVRHTEDQTDSSRNGPTDEFQRFRKLQLILMDGRTALKLILHVAGQLVIVPNFGAPPKLGAR